MKLFTFLNYGGNCERAFRFYEQHLAGKITAMITHGQVPDPSRVPPELKNKILHARLSLGETELWAADVPPERFQPMRSAYLTLSVQQHKRGGTNLWIALRGRPDLHADGGDLFCFPVCDAAGQVRHFLDDHPRTSRPAKFVTTNRR